MKNNLIVCVFFALILICYWIYKGENAVRKREKNKYD